MTAFAFAIDAIFGDPHMARDAIWRSAGVGDPVALRVIRRGPDRVATFGDGRFIAGEALMIYARIADVPDLAAGDTLEIGGDRYEVRGDPIRDPERLYWAAEARPL